MIDLRGALLTCGGLGRLEPGPGTWGSMPPAAAALALVLAGTPAWGVNAALAATAILFSGACVAFGRWAEERFAAADPRPVVADEVAGQCLALLGLPWRTGTDQWAWNAALVAVAFGAFRLFDILKPQPARAAERLPRGIGVLADDLVAGLYALAVTQVVARVPWPGL